MGFVECMKDWCWKTDQREALEHALAVSYTTSRRRAAQLREHARIAPQKPAVESLQSMAADEDRQCEELKNEILVLGGSVVDPETRPVDFGGINHWRRLVADLEAHRNAALRYKTLATTFALSPSTAEFFERLSTEEFVHSERLRDLLAWADPHAVD